MPQLATDDMIRATLDQKKIQDALQSKTTRKKNIETTQAIIQRNTDSSGAITVTVAGALVGGVAISGVVTYAPVAEPFAAVMTFIESTDDLIPGVTSGLREMEPSVEDVAPRQVGRVMEKIRQARNNMLYAFEKLEQAQGALADADFPEAQRAEAEALIQQTTNTLQTQAVEVDQMETRITNIHLGILDALRVHI